MCNNKKKIFKFENIFINNPDILVKEIDCFEIEHISLEKVNIQQKQCEKDAIT